MKAYRKLTFTMKFYTIGFCAFLFGLTIVPAYAQMNAMYTVLPSSEVKEAPANGETEVAVTIFDFGINIPLYERVNEKKGTITSIGSRLDFRVHEFVIDFPDGVNEYLPDTLYSINYTVDGVTSLNSKWFMVGLLSTGISSDFENVDSDHFFAEGGVIFAKKLSNLTLGIGPAYTYAFGNPKFILAPLIKYSSHDEKFTVDVKAPKHAILGYSFSEKYQGALALRTLYNNYSLGDDMAVDQEIEHLVPATITETSYLKEG